MNKIVRRTDLVVKSNQLIEAAYNMTLNELRIFEMCLCQVDSRAPLDKEQVFTITVENAQELFYTETNKRNAYHDLKVVSERLFKREAKITLDDHRYVLTHFVSWIEYDDREFNLKIKFAEKIIPFISQLQKNFTKHRINYISRFNSSHSLQLYDMLTKWIGLGKDFVEIEFDTLRFQIAEGKYKNNKDFRVRVLDVALSEINTHSDLWVEMLLLKRRKTFERIQFKFGRKQGIAKEEEKRKIEAKEKTERNAVAKKARLQKDHAEATKHDNKKILEEYHKHPEGTTFSDAKGKKYFKTSSGILMGEDGGAILEQDAAVLIKKGVLAGAFS